MIEANSLIRASAGTGKTFALATRFIRLLMFDRADPASIIALTFSRAAAQEIYEKILARLAAAAKDEESAAKEWENLLGDFRPDGDGVTPVPDGERKCAWILSQDIPHGACAFRRLLRRLVDAQHLGTIATIDSFLLRFYQNFPKEMGFQRAVEVIDAIDEDGAVNDALVRALSRAHGSEAVVRAFRAAKDGDFSRTCLASIATILSQGWRAFVVSRPDCRAWTVASMCAALGVPEESRCPDLSGLPVNEIARKNTMALEARFIDKARTYDGRGRFFQGNKVDDLIRFFWETPDATSWTYTLFGKTYVFACGADGARTVRDAIRHMVNVHLKRQLERVKAKIELALAVEDEYHQTTRRAGRLTFDDLTQNTVGDALTERGNAIEHVAFRFDSRFDHWALDEFQDTSERQWKRLARFVSEAAGDGHNGEARSAMVVGDLKQSIYTWRGASARPFETVAAWPAFAACARDLKMSYRYGPNIAAFVNKVFGPANIAPNTFPDVCRPAATAWAAGWRDHVSKQPEDFVQVIGVDASGAASEEDPMLAALQEAVEALWRRHQDANSRDTVAIVVRSNTDGWRVAEALRARRLPAVWEGMNAVGDLPVVQAILALLTLAEHPADTAAWTTVNTLYPVRARVFPDLHDAASVSAVVSRKLARQGLARTLKAFCACFDGAFDPASAAAERLHQLVEQGAAFEARVSNGGSVDAFVAFLEKSAKRTSAVSSHVIRVLTIHRSKGLGFDHLFVPLFEKARHLAAIDRPKVQAPLAPAGRDAAWVLPHLEKGVEAFNPETAATYADMCSERLMESLRTYYVALTRAKKSLCVLFPNETEPSGGGTGLLMRDVIARAVGPLPYGKGRMPAFASDGKKDSSPTAVGAVPFGQADGPRDVVERVSPSGTSPADGAGCPAAVSLFDAARGAAAQRGTDRHAGYQAIAWLDAGEAASLPAAFRPAFVKPSDEATLWRERGYEWFEDGRWESGRFDRVVFAGQGEARTATIYDFKTNAIRPDESPAAFAARMRTTYAAQMAAYRRALARVTGMDAERISAVLLLEATGERVAFD